ncbi:hypothetical protein ARMA_0997 [Ardenticatena maritima]|uniref:Uncharacterized protein n=1 Tax=Ardenticatena maritima TaxID=872965 RepID=A0A0M9UC57_9CHLR|nr:hypothetical protein ARMA_0997 [Ardenticatena maritima]
MGGDVVLMRTLLALSSLRILFLDTKKRLDAHVYDSPISANE